MESTMALTSERGDAGFQHTSLVVPETCHCASHTFFCVAPRVGADTWRRGVAWPGQGAEQGVWHLRCHTALVTARLRVRCLALTSCAHCQIICRCDAACRPSRRVTVSAFSWRGHEIGARWRAGGQCDFSRSSSLARVSWWNELGWNVNPKAVPIRIIKLEVLSAHAIARVVFSTAQRAARLPRTLGCPCVAFRLVVAQTDRAQS